MIEVTLKAAYRAKYKKIKFLSKSLSVHNDRDLNHGALILKSFSLQTILKPFFFIPEKSPKGFKTQIIAIGGDEHLGGCNFDQMMIDHVNSQFVEHMKSAEFDLNVDRNEYFRDQIRKICIETKKALQDHKLPSDKFLRYIPHRFRYEASFSPENQRKNIC